MQTAPLLTRTSLPEQIKDHLLAKIMSGALMPGDRLVEMKIAAEMETSQAPVREAIRELEAIGVVESLRNKGSRVRIISDDELKDMYDVRAQLEGYATELVTRKKAPVSAELRTIIKSMKTAAKAGNSADFATHNSAFHRVILQGADNIILFEIWSALNVKSRTLINVSRQKSDLNEIAASHENIVDAIESGNPSKARKAAAMHVLENKPL